VLKLKSFATRGHDRSIVPPRSPRAQSFLPQTTNAVLYFHCALGFPHPNTCTHVRLLGPCFKTGRIAPFRQSPERQQVTAALHRHANTAHIASYTRSTHTERSTHSKACCRTPQSQPRRLRPPRYNRQTQSVSPTSSAVISRSIRTDLDVPPQHRAPASTRTSNTRRSNQAAAKAPHTHARQ